MRRYPVRELMVLAAGALVCAAGCVAPPAATASRDARRYTAAAEVYPLCRESVVTLGVSRRDEKDPKTTHTEFGSGVVLHEAGYILTNAHALRYGGKAVAGFCDKREFPARVVAVDEGKDLAILKVEVPGRALKPIRLGHSRDLIVGERVVSMGSPFGMGLTVTEGVVSALGRATKSEYTFYPDMVQTDANPNPGGSGGPLLNVWGELVGLNTTMRAGANDIGFAIPVDRIRASLPEVLDAEGRFGFVLGLQVATDGPAQVTGVTRGSPAEAAGVRAGDVVTGAGPAVIAGGIDFYLALVECRPGQALPMHLLRDGKAVNATVTPGKVEPRAADSVSGVVGGLNCACYEGKWDRLPDFTLLRPAGAGKAAAFDLAPYRGKDNFALKFTGYIDIPADGIYAFYTASDEGSRLWIGDRLVVDNDGLHAKTERRGFLSLKAGKHPITVAYFERLRDEELKVSWEGPGIPKQPVPASVLFSAGPG